MSDALEQLEMAPDELSGALCVVSSRAMTARTLLRQADEALENVGRALASHAGKGVPLSLLAVAAGWSTEDVEAAVLAHGTRPRA